MVIIIRLSPLISLSPFFFSFFYQLLLNTSHACIIQSEEKADEMKLHKPLCCICINYWPKKKKRKHRERSKYSRHFVSLCVMMCPVETKRIHFGWVWYVSPCSPFILCVGIRVVQSLQQMTKNKHRWQHCRMSFSKFILFLMALLSLHLSPGEL